MSVLDDMDDVEYLHHRLRSAVAQTADMLTDVSDQDGLQLTGTVMRLEHVQYCLSDAVAAVGRLFEDALERDRMLNANRTVSRTPSGGSGVVADILSASTARVRPNRGAVDHVFDSAANVAGA